VRFFPEMCVKNAKRRPKIITAWGHELCQRGWWKAFEGVDGCRNSHL